MRRSGATAMLEMGHSFETARIVGRWASEQAAREYIRIGQMMLLRLRRDVRKNVWRHIDALASMGAALFGA